MTEDGKLYLIAGDHDPLNRKLAPLAGKTVTLRGKLTSRGDMHLINRRDREVEHAHGKLVAEARVNC